MSNKDKMTIAANIVTSIMSNSSRNVEDRLDLIPKALEKIYNKICELDKTDNDSNINACDIECISQQVV